MAEPSPSVSPSSPSANANEAVNPSRGELPIVQATTDLIQWFVPLLNRLPRDQKFALGDRIINNLYAVLEALVAARWSRDKRPLLEPAATRLDLLRIQTRLLHDFQLMNSPASQQRRRGRWREPFLGWGGVKARGLGQPPFCEWVCRNEPSRHTAPAVANTGGGPFGSIRPPAADFPMPWGGR